MLQHKINLGVNQHETDDREGNIVTAETEQNEFSNPLNYWKDIKQFFTDKNSIEGIQALADSNVKELTKILVK